MIIAIEGPRNSGKTSLAKVIAEELGWELEHWSAPEVGWNSRRDFNRLEPAKNNPKVWDRAWVGRHVYGHLRHHASLHPEALMRHELMMSGVVEAEGMRLMLLPYLTHLHNRWEPEDNQQFTVDEELFWFKSHADIFGWTAVRPPEPQTPDDLATWHKWMVRYIRDEIARKQNAIWDGSGELLGGNPSSPVCVITEESTWEGIVNRHGIDVGPTMLHLAWRRDVDEDHLRRQGIFCVSERAIGAPAMLLRVGRLVNYGIS